MKIETRDLVRGRTKEEMKKRTGHTRWYAGDQLEALAFYLTPEATIVFQSMEQDYQGDVMAVIEAKGKVILWRDSFGSCSGCDALDYRDVDEGFQYISMTMSEGNTKQFDSYSEAYEWLSKTNDFWWRENHEREAVLAFLKEKAKEEKERQ